MSKKSDIAKSVCAALLESEYITGYAYDHFRQSEAVPPPFAVYRRVAKDNFSADGAVYHHGDGVDLELYASDPDEMETLMEAVEALFDSAEVFYNLTADTAYIESEDFYESLYEI